MSDYSEFIYQAICFELGAIKVFLNKRCLDLNKQNVKALISQLTRYKTPPVLNCH